MSETEPHPIDQNRSSGAVLSEAIEQDIEKRGKARNVKPLRKLLPFIGRYPGTVTLFLVFLTLASLLNLALPFAFRVIIDCGLIGDGEIAQSCKRYAIGEGTEMGSYFKFGIFIGISTAVFAALRFYFISVLGQRVIADLRTKVYNRLTGLSTEFYERVHTGEVLSRLTTDTTLIESIIGSSFSFALRHIVGAIGAIIAMFIINPKLTLMVLAIGPVTLLPVILIGRRIRTLSRSSQNNLATASSRASESLSAIQTVQAFTRETKERNDFSSAVESTFAAHKKRIAVRSLMTFLIFGIGMSGMIGMIWYGSIEIVNSKQSGGNAGMTSGAITQFAFYAFTVISSAGFLTGTWTEFLRASGATERVIELLEEIPDITAPANPAPYPQDIENIIFEDISFAYPTRPDIQALHNVSFNIKAGETIALVGPSGAGKSTVFQLLLRFYDIQSGQVCLNTVPVTKFDPQDLRKQFAIVQQNTPLFSGTAMENIRYGREGATSEDVIAAAKSAFAHDFIRALPNGYETNLGEAATTLSGGQRQRIAIARAILRDAPILLLDEATSALDAESELAVQRAFDIMSQDKTTLIIAHRLATVRKADRIFVMEGGQIVEIGTHDSLIKNGQLYARLAKLQFTDQNAS